MVRGVLAQRSDSKTTADAGGDKDSRLECAGVQTARGPHVDRLLLGTGGGSETRSPSRPIAADTTVSACVACFLGHGSRSRPTWSFR